MKRFKGGSGTCFVWVEGEAAGGQTGMRLGRTSWRRWHLKEWPIWTSGDGEAKYCWWREQPGHTLSDETWVACESSGAL